MLRRLQTLALFGGDGALHHQVDHTDDAVHGRAQLMRHVGQELALGIARGLGSDGGLLQLFRTLADAFFEQLLMLADFLLRCHQRLDHSIEAVT